MSRIPIKYPYNISVSLYGDYFVAEDWIRTFMAFAERWQERLSVQYFRFGCMYYAHDKIDLKELRYIKRNRKRIDQLVTTQEIHSISFTAVEKEADQARDMECVIKLTEPHPNAYVYRPYHHFFLLVVPEVMKRVIQTDVPVAFFTSLLHEVEEQLMDVRYGLIQPMASEKLAGLYFVNIFSDHLSQAEEDKLFIWKGSNREYSTKIWSTFWGNVLTDKHLGAHREVILERIRKIVGPENLVEWRQGKYFFALPVDILDFLAQQARLEQYTRQLDRLFAEYELLMTRDIRDIPVEVLEEEEKGIAR